MKHIIEAQQFTRELLERTLFPSAREMQMVLNRGGSSELSGKRMITLFYEPSTRTRASFEIGMNMLGGKVIFSTENAAQFSSAAKGETLRDTIRVLNRYRPDVIVLRHKEEGSAKLAANNSQAAIINAGDGADQHPTQALLDLYTIEKKLGRIDGLSIAMVGDLARGRTVRSLSYLLGKYSGITIYFVSPDYLKMRYDIKAYLLRHGVAFYETENLMEAASLADVIYQTRFQKERQAVEIDRPDECFHITSEITAVMKPDAIIMHPLPRNEEIAEEVDQDPGAVYLTDQIDSGLFIRMALLKMILS